MTLIEELKEALLDEGYGDSVVLENPDYATAVIGRSEDGRLIYSYEKMVEFLMVTDGMSREDAIEFVDYNTIRALPYMGERAPIIMYEIK
jgi:hypothetical protein